MAEDAFRYVLPAYTDVSRGYHGINHVIDLLTRAHEYGDERAFEPGTDLLNQSLYDAILFHDYVYDVLPNKKSNEERSADAYRKFVGANDLHFHYTESLILATQHHFDFIQYDNYLTNLMLDIDVMGFADVDFARFRASQEMIDYEYEMIFQPHYVRQKRRDFLQNILDKRSLRYRVVENADILTELAYSNIYEILCEMEP